MYNTKPTLLILAAGLGSRYGSLKQIDRIGPSGERIIDYSVFDAIRAGFGKVVYVIRKSFEEEFNEVIIDELPLDIKASYVFQEMDSLENDFKINSCRTKPWGTGHALLSASKEINEPFVVINADDFYGAESYKIAHDFLIYSELNKSNYALIGYKLKNTLSEYGNVARGICEIDTNDLLTSIVERTQIKKDNNKIFFKDDFGNWEALTGDEIISMNMFAFTPKIFGEIKKSFDSFLRKNSEDLKKEFYIPTAVDEIIKNNIDKVKVLETSASWVGLTFKEDKNIVSEKIQNWIEEGKYPRKLW